MMGTHRARAWLLTWWAAFLIGGMQAAGQTQSRPSGAEVYSGARVEEYKSIGTTRLRLFIFEPEGRRAADRTPAIVFFFGGAWRSGSPAQFVPHCKHLASRGMVAIAAEYRVHSRHGVNVVDCVADAESAIRWVRRNADRLGIDPDRIAAGGGSAGGHLAAATSTLADYTGVQEDRSVSFRPNALVLFNPALDLTAKGFGAPDENAPRYQEGLGGRLGAPAADLSPTFHVKAGLPPTIIFHGKEDRTVPYAQPEAFAKAMTEAKNRCELVGFEGKGHAFFNAARDRKAFTDTLLAADRFLVSLAFLKGSPASKPSAAATQASNSS